MMSHILVWRSAAFLVLLPLLAVFTIRRMPTRTLNIIRVLLYLTIAAALGGISFRDHTGTLVVLADRSRSMPGSDSDESRMAMTGMIRTLERSVPAGSRLGVISFAGSSFVERLPEATVFDGLRSQPPDPHVTDIAGAIESALEMIPADSSGRILLLSDGLHTAGSSVSAAVADAAARGISIDFRMLAGNKTTDDIAVLSLDAPLRVEPGEIFTVAAHLYAPSPRRAVCSIRMNGGEWTPQEIELRRGTTTVSWSARSDIPGTVNYEVRLDAAEGAPPDPVPGNNRVRRIVTVESHDPKPVLLITESPSQNLARLLRESGMDIKVLSPSPAALAPDVLAGVSGVIFENVKASSFSPDSLEFLKELVGAGSLGFMMTGGRSSFAVGGYYRSALEEVLPVTLEQRETEKKGMNAVVVVLDRSGSMNAHTSKGITKMSLANAATAEVLDHLADSDMFGVIAVDTDPHTILNLTPVPNARTHTKLIRSIESTGGGIYTYTGLKAAFDMLEKCDITARHVILFADASDAEEQGKYKTLLATSESKGITVSVIGLGTKRDSDAKFLEDVAKRGRGQIYFTDKAEELPRIFVEDTFTMVRSTFTDTPVSAIPRDAARLMPGAGSFSDRYDFDGCNICYLRPGCNALFVSDDEDRSPIVATGHFGLGQTVAFCAEADGKYTGPFAQDPGNAPLLNSLVSWMIAPDLKDDDFMITQEIRNGIHYAAIELDPARKDDPFRSMPTLNAVFHDENGKTESRTYPLVWDGPDRLVAEVPLPGGVIVFGSINWDDEKHPLAPVELPYSPEFIPDRTAGRELTDLLRANGGHERLAVEETWNDLPKHSRDKSLTPFFCLAAILLFLLEIAERRFVLIGRLFSARRNRKAGADVPDKTGAAESSSDADAPAVKRPGKRRKGARSASTAPQTAARKSAQTPSPEKTAEPEANSLSAALRKASRH